MMMIMTINVMFLFMNHPMSMGVTLILQTLMIATITGMKMKTFWMSYILVITMLSGMLVLFIYMSTVASNEKFKNSMKLWFTLMIMLIVSLSFLLLEKKMIIKNNYLGVEMMKLNLIEMFYIQKMFNLENMKITLMLVLYLFFTMIVSSYLINISEGPMRLKI